MGVSVQGCGKNRKGECERQGRQEPGETATAENEQKHELIVGGPRGKTDGPVRQKSLIQRLWKSWNWVESREEDGEEFPKRIRGFQTDS